MKNEMSDTWEHLRLWCVQCIDTYLNVGRCEACRMVVTLPQESFKSASGPVKEIVLMITDALNEAPGLVWTQQEEAACFNGWQNVFGQYLSPEGTLRGMIEGEALIENKSLNNRLQRMHAEP